MRAGGGPRPKGTRLCRAAPTTSPFGSPGFAAVLVPGTLRNPLLILDWDAPSPALPPLGDGPLGREVVSGSVQIRLSTCCRG